MSDEKPWWWDTERCPNCKDRHVDECGCFTEEPDDQQSSIDFWMGDWPLAGKIGPY